MARKPSIAVNQTHRELKQASSQRVLAHDYARLIASCGRISRVRRRHRACPAASRTVGTRSARGPTGPGSAPGSAVRGARGEEAPIKGPGTRASPTGRGPGYISRTVSPRPATGVPAVRGPSPPPGRTGQDPANHHRSRDLRELETWLNAFFPQYHPARARNSVPDASFVGTTYFKRPALEVLIG